MMSTTGEVERTECASQRIGSIESAILPVDVRDPVPPLMGSHMGLRAEPMDTHDRGARRQLISDKPLQFTRGGHLAPANCG